MQSTLIDSTSLLINGKEAFPEILKCIENAENIVAVVNTNECALPNDVEGDCYYVVTALNRANNESPACKPIKVKAAKK